MPGGKVDKAAVRTAFDEAYLRQYGHANPAARIEVVTIRVMGVGRLDAAAGWSRRGTAPAADVDAAGHLRRQDGAMPPSSSAARLTGTRRVAGPAIIEEPTATTILPPGWRATIAAGGHMLITRGRR